MKKLFLTITAGVLALVAIIFIGGYFQKKGGVEKPVTNQREGKVPITIGAKTIYSEVSDNQEKRAKGLSGRTELAGDEGMIFIFDQKDIQPPFWMKGMLIPLDFIWINNGEIVQLDENVQPPTNDSNIITITPLSPIDYVLEVNAGYVSQNNLKIKDKVDIKFE